MNALPEKDRTNIAPADTHIAITPQMQVVLDYLEEYGEIGSEELQELLNIKQTRAYLLTRQMSQNGLIEIIGRGAKKKYRKKLAHSIEE